ncbi:hypothetical protein [Antrihabitans cavernicola]|uniref:DUF559 domain-containing protein n=1 Tax=Antrihabitans cavernicola TaxID=2495913 RepID=A0A5A7SGY1_9NOCA|nr:hypothetical protein [Spelaeibacter cavernicola]KAA0024639.1 hypothetical protein FOY51_01440 [Spelaeibacter cavernicola]
MHKPRWSYADLEEASIDCVIRSTWLAELHVPDGTVVRKCRPGGPWQRLLPGIVLLHNATPTQHQRIVAASLYAGEDSLLTGYAGLAAHGYSRWNSADVHILIPHARRRSSAGFVTIERSRRMPDPVRRGSVTCSPITRCIIDASRRMKSLGTCRSLLVEPIQRGDTSVEQLAVELAASSSTGSALPRSVLAELSEDAHSVAEIAAQKLYKRAGLPKMVHNIDICDGSGTFVARPDGWLDDVGLAWEIDSIRYHFSPTLHAQTLARRARMQRYGIVVVTHLPNQIRDEPEVVLADLRDNYRHATQRPRPPLRMREQGDPSPRPTELTDPSLA